MICQPILLHRYILLWIYTAKIEREIKTGRKIKDRIENDVKIAGISKEKV